MSGVEVFANYAQTTTTSTSGTTAPASGTTETWTVTSSTGFPGATTGGNTFHIADPALPGEVIQVTNVSGTTWTVIRGAESTTPVAHATGATFKQVVTAGFLNGLAAYILPSGDTTGATDPANVNVAINTLAAHNGGTVFLGPGQWYGNSAVTYQPTDTTFGPKVFIRGAGRKATYWNNVGSTDAFRISWPNMPATGTVDFIGSGLLDLTIDGSSATGSATGLHIGDGLGYVVDAHFTNFSGVNQIALRCDNANTWTEKAYMRGWFYNCANAVILDTTGTHSSYEYCNFEFFVNLRGTNQNAMTMQNGSYLEGGSLAIRGNMPASGGTVLTLTGVNGGINSHIFRSHIEIVVETTASTGGPQTINFGSTSNKFQDNSGVMKFTSGTFVASNAVASQFTFGGPIVGDSNLITLATTAGNAPSGWA